MAHQNSQKLSNLAQYDDMCRYTKVLTSGPEQEFKIFVEHQLKCCKESQERKSEVEKLREKLSKLEFSNRKFETQIKLLKDSLLHATKQKKYAELERDSLERQIDLIKELLSADVLMDNQTKEKLGVLGSIKRVSPSSSSRLQTIAESTASVLSLSDIDRTEDDLALMENLTFSHACQSRKNRSSSESRISQGKRRHELADQETTSEDAEESHLHHKSITVRCNSEPISTSPEIEVVSRAVHKSGIYYVQHKSKSVSTCGGTPVSRYSTGGKLSRQHAFVSKTLCKPEKCNPCRHSIGFFGQALKCQDCAIICHLECKDKCPVPCIPYVHTPTENTTGTIADYTSSAAPMIPPLIAHCVNEIESRGLGEKGLYRVSGSEREVKILKEKLLNGRCVPLLHKNDINAICGAVKGFLQSLSEPLITRGSWQDFAKAANLEDTNQSLRTIYEIVNNLPQANRDTLAFMVLHLQKVAASPDCKMPVTSLAKIFGPTIVGYSLPDPAEMNVLKDTADQVKIMERILSISPDLWQHLLNVEPEVFMSNGKTPENIPAPKGGKLLGPLLPPGRKSKAVLSSNRTPLTSRNSRKYHKSAKASFSSPLIK